MPDNEVFKNIQKFFKLMVDNKVSLEPTPYDIVYHFEGMKLRRYRSNKKNSSLGPILFVYALINKPSVLDLEPGKSVIEKYVNAGFDVFMIDWENPTEVDIYNTIGDYVERYIRKAVKRVKSLSKSNKIHMFGYCMGGTFSTMYATLHPEEIKTLTIMASPIAFPDESNSILHVWPKHPDFPIEKIADTYKLVPPSFFNSAFYLLDPVGNGYLKYVNLYNMISNDPAVENFLRMEYWINDGIFMSGETYKEFLSNGYRNNMLVKNEWIINGKKIRLANINMPTAVIVGDKDTLVDPNSTKALLDHISSEKKKIFEYPSGHIGLAVSRKTHANMWPEVIKWVSENSSNQ